MKRGVDSPSFFFFQEGAEMAGTRSLRDEINEILREKDTHELAQALGDCLKEVPFPDEEGEELLRAILRDVAEELPVERAMWMAFRLGIAWEKSGT